MGGPSYKVPSLTLVEIRDKNNGVPRKAEASKSKT
jgi:hypothetical protein